MSLETAGRITARSILYIVLAAFGILMVMPFYWMIVTSFQIPENLIAFPPKWWPNPPTLEHFEAAIDQAPFLLYYRNSLIVAAISVSCSVIFGLFAGYAFAVYQFPLQNFLFILILSTLMVPIQVTSVSLYILMARLRWIDTFPGILAPNFASAFGVFFMRQTIKGMPGDLIDAARIDGAGEIRIVATIIAPLVKSVMATVALILFIDSWNDFLWPVIVINSERLRTLPVGIAFFKDPYRISFGPLMAAASIATVPTILVYLLVQKFIIKGIATTGLKF
ncbi:MAG: carbohydrate ABC transporter permease [Spirochaetaceae bacterium]|nr:MAG: carbohydrate ABC transporter permease [Spirochaetaceae bacterium]